MRISVEAWSPDYGGEVDFAGPEDATVEVVDVTCEGREWLPVEPGPLGALADLPLAFVDGTRRLDARVFITPNGGMPTPGLAGSVGVGAVVCDPAPSGVNGRRSSDGITRRAEIVDLRIDRFLAGAAGTAAELPAGPGLDYRRLPVPGPTMDACVYGIHEAMRAREAALALELAGDHLVFIDGPLAVMRPGPQAIVGFIKSHHVRYLTDEDETILQSLGCGQRTPLFCFGEPRPRYAWYLRLCDLPQDQHAWHGLIRCEAPAALPLDDVTALADASAALLPAFASLPYWDPRAPQNLVPVAGLEKRLHHLLGDRELIYRMIRSAAKRVSDRGDAVA